jgi:hypothetical protein
MSRWLTGRPCCIPRPLRLPQHFITAMDALKLNMVAVDQLCPILNDLLHAMNKVSSLSADFGPKTKVKVGHSTWERAYGRREHAAHACHECPLA